MHGKPHTTDRTSQYKEALKKMSSRYGGSTSGKRMEKPVMKKGGCTLSKLNKRK